MDIEIKSLSEEDRKEAVALRRIRDVLMGLYLRKRLTKPEDNAELAFIRFLGKGFVERYRTQEEKLKRIAIDHGAKPGDKVRFVDDSCSRTVAKIFI